MRNYIITITEEEHDPNADTSTHEARRLAPSPILVEHYRRRIIATDIEPAIDALNLALKQVLSTPRKPRADKGKPRSKPADQPQNNA